MRKKLLSLLALLGLTVFAASAQLFTTSPAILQESSENVVLKFHANNCDVAALKNSTSDLYAHIGVYTTKSPSTWIHIKEDWGSNKPSNTFKRGSGNVYELTIGDLRTYFGVTDPSERITKVCVIARNAAGSAQTADNFIDVYEEGYAMAFTSSPANTIITKSTTISFTAYATEASSIKIYVDGVEKKSGTNTKELTYSQSFATEGGNWEVKAVATNGTDTKESAISVVYVAPSKAKDYPGGKPKMGAVKNADGTVTFCLAAPGKNSVMLIGSWDDYSPSASSTTFYQDYEGQRYFWTTVAGLKSSTDYLYYYLVDGKYKVADPYAHLILDNHSDKWLDAGVYDDRPAYPYDRFDDTCLAVYRDDIDAYDWKVNNFKIANRESLVIYEMLFRDFTGSDKTADGTVRKAIEKIPYLADLGVTAVELMPIMEFNGNNSWGYNTNFYMAPDKAYGSPADYKEFIDRCHQAGIAVILDIVFNQTDGLHPWYQMYEAGTSPFYNAVAPHGYSVLNDINQGHPLIEKHWEDVLTYWLTQYKVDGFRFDLVKGLGDNESYKTSSNNDTDKYNASRVARMSRLHAIIKRVNPDALHINENLAWDQEETEMGNDGQLCWNKQTGPSTQYVKGTGGDLTWMLSTACKRPAYSTVDYAESHDEERLMYSAMNNDDSKAKSKSNSAKRMAAVGAQMLMTPGPKMIWQFGELYADETTKNSEGNNTDPKKVLWGNLTPGPVANSHYIALHDSYRAMVNLRKNNPEMFGPAAQFTISGFGDNTGARTMKLSNGSKEIIGFFNPSTTAAKVSISATCASLRSANYQLITASKDFEPVVKDGTNKVTVDVPGNGFCVLATKDLSDVEEIIDGATAPKAQAVGGVGEIIIKGDYDDVAVYTISGQAVGSLKVSAGVYVVVIDGEVSKVIVR